MAWAQGISAVGNAAAGAGTLAGAFKGGGKQKTENWQKPFRSRISTPNYFFRGGQLARRSDMGLEQERSLQQRLGALGATVAPGASAMRNALGGLFGSARQRSIGDLKGSLAARGILGASFANDQISQLEADFAQQEAAALAATYEKEFAQSMAVLEAENILRQQRIQQELAELGIATNFLQTVNQITDGQSKALSDLAARDALINSGFDPDELPLQEPAPAPKTSTTTSYPSTTGRFGIYNNTADHVRRG